MGPTKQTSRKSTGPYSRKEPLDTPFHLRPQTSTTVSVNIDDAGRKDLHNHFLVCDTTEFLDNVLPVPKSCVDEVIKKLPKDSIYKNGRWARMPASDSVGEDKHYESFVDIANAISDVVKAITSGDRRVNGVWVDRHSKSPKSPYEDAANTRPGCVNVTSSAVIEELDDAIALARQERDKARSEKEKEEQNMSVWWRQVHVPMELRAKYGPKDWLEACTQLCCYMRQVLGEQLDRRFVVGLVLCFNQLTVLLSDRSGILGTSTPINIHKNPRQFIQVMASFTVLAAPQIGWDPAMEVYDPESGTSCPSYKINTVEPLITHTSDNP